MILHRPAALEELATYLPRFLDLCGRDRWFKRVDQLDAEQRVSPYLWKIVADYHWLELAVSFQSDVLEKEGRLVETLIDVSSLSALYFAAAIVEVHEHLGSTGRTALVGRLRDGLKAKVGFAALYLEMDMAQRLAAAGCAIAFPDLEGTGQHDIEFADGAMSGEFECKSLSVDAGRKIHRQDFYRLIDAMAPYLLKHAKSRRREILLVDLDNRLRGNLTAQGPLRAALAQMLSGPTPDRVEGPDFAVTRLAFEAELPEVALVEPNALTTACQSRFGMNCHAAGAMGVDGGCLIVLKSKREDDTSKPLLEAMRKAATQFTGQRPSFIAVQFDDIAPADFVLPHVRWRAALLSYALYLHYGAKHVNATCFSGFTGTVVFDGELGTPSFAVPNPEPEHPWSGRGSPAFLNPVSDHLFAKIVGARRPQQSISVMSFTPRPADN